MQGYVIGGLWRFVEQNTAPFLREYGIEVDEKHHHPFGTIFNGPLPKDAEVVIILEEQLVKAQVSSQNARHLARAKGIPCVTGTVHKSHFHKLMEQYGFKRVLSPGGVAVLMAEEPKMSKPTPTTPDYERLSFEQFRQELAKLLRAARDKHGLTEVMWSRDTSLETKRVAVESHTVEV